MIMFYHRRSTKEKKKTKKYINRLNNILVSNKMICKLNIHKKITMKMKI